MEARIQVVIKAKVENTIFLCSRHRLYNKMRYVLLCCKKKLYTKKGAQNVNTIKRK